MLFRSPKYRPVKLDRIRTIGRVTRLFAPSSSAPRTAGFPTSTPEHWQRSSSARYGGQRRCPPTSFCQGARPWWGRGQLVLALDPSNVSGTTLTELLNDALRDPHDPVALAAAFGMANLPKDLRAINAPWERYRSAAAAPSVIRRRWMTRKACSPSVLRRARRLRGCRGSALPSAWTCRGEQDEATRRGRNAL